MRVFAGVGLASVKFKRSLLGAKFQEAVLTKLVKNAPDLQRPPYRTNLFGAD